MYFEPIFYALKIKWYSITVIILRLMEVYPEKMDSTHHIIRVAHDACTFHFLGVYLYPPKNYYSHSLIHQNFHLQQFKRKGGKRGRRSGRGEGNVKSETYIYLVTPDSADERETILNKVLHT